MVHSRATARQALRLAFRRRKSFAIPPRLVLDGVSVALESPAEHGPWADFVQIFLGDCYCIESLRRSDHQIRHILDVGANCGWFSMAARGYFPSATIHAYEPNPRLSPVLRHNVSELGVVVHAEAVGSRDGSVTLVATTESNQGRTIEGGDIPSAALRTAIDRLGGRVDLVKLDCEGAEWSMLDDPLPWLAVDWLTMEYHLWARRDLTHEDAAASVSRLGFRILKQTPTGDYGLLLARRQPNRPG